MNYTDFQSYVSSGNVGDTYAYTNVAIDSVWSTDGNRVCVTSQVWSDGKWYHTWINGQSKGAFRTMKEAIDFGMSIVAYVDPDNVVHNGDNERTMKTVSRTIRLTDVARIREVCRTAGIRLAVQVDAETAELIVLHQDATKFVRLLDNELSR